MTKPYRVVGVDEAATILGVTRATVVRYSKGALPGFPAPTNGTAGVRAEWLAGDLRAWLKTRAGVGGRGVPKDRQGTACEDCGNVVERRFRDKKTGRMRCKGCDLLAGEAELGG